MIFLGFLKQSDYCEFCETDGKDYNVEEAAASGNVASGMALQCPSGMEHLASECPVLSKSAKAYVAFFVTALIALGLGAYWYKSRPTESEKAKKEPFVDGKGPSETGVVA